MGPSPGAGRVQPRRPRTPPPRGRLARRLLTAGVALTAAVVLADVAGVPLGPVRGVGSSLLGPVERAVAPGGGEEQRQAEEALAVRERLRALEDQQRTDDASQTIAAETAELTAAVDLVPGRVVGLARGGASGPERLTIDLGSRDGIEADLAVVAPGGLVGRVVEVSPWTSDVEVIGSGGADVGVRVGAERLLGALTGSDAVTARDADQLVVTSLTRGRLAVGDEVVTLGSPGGRPYPPGVAVGEVARVADRAGQLTDTAVVDPHVDLARVDVIAVLVPSPGSEGTG